MVTKLSDELEELMDEESDAALPELIEEQLRYEQLIIELTEFEEAFESNMNSAMSLLSHASK